jgi:hypothetical protein
MNSEASPAFEDLLLAYEWVSADPGGENSAYVCRTTGRVYWISDAIDSESDLPEDIEDATRYLAVAHKHDLDLGNRLALQFVADAVPHKYEVAVAYFHHAGAYRKFKDMLEREGKLEKWYEFEAAAVESALRAWVAENELPIR